MPMADANMANANTTTVPTTAFRSGDLSSSTTVIYNPFSGSSDGTGRQPLVATSARGLATVPGPNNTAVDAFNAACSNPAGCPNIIPSALIDPISVKLLALLPAPTNTQTANNYFALLPFHKDTDFVDAKVDANLTNKAQGNFEGSGLQNTYSTGLNYNRFFSNTLVAEFRVGAGWYHNEAHNFDYGTNTSQTLGIPGVNLDKTITSGIVGVTINGLLNGDPPLLGFSASLPWIRSETNIDFANT